MHYKRRDRQTGRQTDRAVVNDNVIIKFEFNIHNLTVTHVGYSVERDILPTTAAATAPAPAQATPTTLS